MPTRWSIPSLIGSYVSDYTGTWFEICEDQPNFYIGEYTKRKPESSGHMGQRHHLPWYGSPRLDLLRFAVPHGFRARTARNRWL